MVAPLVGVLLGAIVPVLVKVAEGLFPKSAPDAPGRGGEKHQWVHQAVQDIADNLDAKLPEWAKPSKSQWDEIVSQLIEDALDRIDPL